MLDVANNYAFWVAVDQLVDGSELIIDRPRGSRHPRFPEIICPLDYGYLAGTTSMDGGGVDVWHGTLGGAQPVGIVCAIDLLKKDSEIKILLGCTTREITVIEQFHNSSHMMKAMVILR